MALTSTWIQQVQPLLESADYTVEHSDTELRIYLTDAETLVLRLRCYDDKENPGLSYIHFDMPLGLEIPDQHWLKAAQEIMAFNRNFPLGQFSLSEASEPYLDYHLQVPGHGEFLLNLLEAVQLSFLFARQLMDSLQHKLTDWLNPRLPYQATA